MAKLLVIAMENTFGKSIRQHRNLCPLFAASFKQGLQHLDDMPWIEGRTTVRLLKFTGKNEADLKDFLKKILRRSPSSPTPTTTKSWPRAC